jgi:hypothetical protein
MAEGHRRVGPGGFLHHECGERLPHDVRAAHDDDLRPRGLHGRTNEQLLDPCRRGRRYERDAHEQLPKVARVEAVRVLVGVDEAQDRGFVDVGREWDLDEDPMHLLVVVQAGEEGQQLLLRRAGAQVMVPGADPDLGACLVFRGDVDLRGGIVADEDRGEARGDAGGGERPDPPGDLRADLCGYRLAVDDLGAHHTPRRRPTRERDLEAARGAS